MATFAEALKRLLRDRSLSQRWLAEATEIDASRLSRICANKNNFKISAETINKIADALECEQCERDSLFIAAGRMPITIEHKFEHDPVAAKLLCVIGRMSREQIVKLYKIVLKNN